LLSLDALANSHNRVDDWSPHEMRHGYSRAVYQRPAHRVVSSKSNVQPFRDVDEPINYFCNKIAGRNATTWAGKLDKPGTSMGECNQFSSQNNSMVPITQIGYYLSIGLT
jgi:hypothetical protein